MKRGASSRLRQISVNAFNRLAIPSAIMLSRPLSAAYFDWKYRRDDPYRTGTDAQGRYADTLALLPDRRFECALDLGTGEGHLAAQLLERCERVHGVDISRAAIDTAQRLYGHDDRLSFEVGDMLSIAFRCRFDLVVCTEVLYYLTWKQLLQVGARLSSWTVPRACLVLGHRKCREFPEGFFRMKFGGERVVDAVLRNRTWRVLKRVDRGNDLLVVLERTPY